jgi:hypothetical protein
MDVPITSRQSRLIAGIVRELKVLGYSDALIKKNYVFQDWYNQDDPMPPVAVRAAFGEMPFEPESACFAVFTSNGDHGKDLVLKYRALGAPLALEVSDEWVDFWKVGRTKDTTEHRRRVTNESELADYFHEHTKVWSPASILQAKNIRARNIDVSAKPRQLDLFDFGLATENAERAFVKLDPLLEDALNAGTSAYEKIAGKKPDPDGLFQLAFWLLAGKVFCDNDIAPFKLLTAESGPEVVLKAVATYYGETLTPLLNRPTRQAVFDKIWTKLSFHHVSIDVLTRIWATTLVTPEVRREQGIHATPKSLVRYIVDRLPFDAFRNVAHLDKEDRFIIEPCSGNAAFLVASLQRLRTDWQHYDLTPREQHKYFQRALVGFENERFGIEIGRIRLTLADRDRDDWQLKPEDVLSSEEFLASLKNARVVLCNPPFQDVKKKDRDSYSLTFVQKPAEILHRILENLHPEGVLGFVLPQVFLDGQEKGYASVRRALADRYATLEVVSLPDAAFRPAASKETILLLATNPKQHPGPTLINHKKVETRDWVQFQLSYEPTSEATASKSSEEIEKSLAVPELGQLWEYLASLDKLGEVAAEIHRGIEWKLRLMKDGRETGNREKLVIDIDDERDGFWPGVPPRYGTLCAFQVPARLKRLDMRPESLDTKEHLTRPWKSPKIILNKAAKSRGLWRIAAFADHVGLTCYQTCMAIWPKDPSHLVVLTAVLNGPVANAFIATREGKTDITKDTLRKIPVPSFSKESKDEIERLVGEYVALVSLCYGTEDMKIAEPLLKKIDAAVLAAYKLPPELERELLGKIRGRRPIPLTIDHIAKARYVRPSRLYLRFADGLEGTWTLEQLDLDMSNMRLSTVKASSAGTYVKVKSRGGEDVQLDSSSLRVLVDPKYAAEIENKLNILASRIGL